MEKKKLPIIECRCTRCRNRHSSTKRVLLQKKSGWTLCCPRCGCGQYNDITEIDKLYCTGFPGIDLCDKATECQLVKNLKRDNPSQLDKRRVYFFTNKELKNCKHFKKIE